MPPASTDSFEERLARVMAALCLAKARSSMTAPMKCERSVTSPMLIASISATRSSLSRAQTERGT